MDNTIKVFKALADNNRLLILEMLSCGEMCACDLMRELNLTQPTVSHHMKILQYAGLIDCKKNGKWMNYSIKKDKFDELISYINELVSYKDKCICEKVK